MILNGQVGALIDIKTVSVSNAEKVANAILAVEAAIKAQILANTAAAANTQTSYSSIVSGYRMPTSWTEVALSYSTGGWDATPTTSNTGSIFAGQGLADRDRALLFGPKATGSNYIPEDMISLIHAGERILPAADNRQLMQFLSTTNQNGGLYEEICRLNAQVEQLTKVVADGAIMNAKATDRNTEELANTMQQTTDQAIYVDRLKSRTEVL